MQNYSSLDGARQKGNPLEDNVRRILRLNLEGENSERERLDQIKDQVIQNIHSSHIKGSEEILRKTWKLLIENNREIDYTSSELPKWGQDLWDGVIAGYPNCVVTFLEWLRVRFGPEPFKQVGQSL